MKGAAVPPGSLACVALSVAIRDAVDDLLAEYAANPAAGASGARASAERHGFTGTDGYIAFWARLAGEPPYPPGYVRTETYIAFEGGRAVGDIRLRRSLTPELERSGGHVGYAVRPSARNRGHATAMLRFVLARAAQLGIAEVLLTIEPGNAASLRVAEKCGASAIDQVSADGERHWRLRVPTGTGGAPAGASSPAQRSRLPDS